MKKINKGQEKMSDKNDTNKPTDDIGKHSVDTEKPESEATQPSPFFSEFEKDRVIIGKTDAGAGFIGLIGFGCLFLVAAVLFITENYFVSMFTISIGLLVYVTGSNIARLLLSSFTIFFSSKHLNANAAQLQDTLLALKGMLKMKRDKEGNIVASALGPGQTVTLPNNHLSQDLQRLIKEKPDFEHAEYIAHSYYVGCHELYDTCSSNYDFVSTAMPLFGLIGTIIGLIAMFDSLGADVTVESLSPQLAMALKTTLYGAIFSSLYKIIGSRFEQRLKILDYDYESFCRALQILVGNKNTIEVE